MFTIRSERQLAFTKDLMNMIKEDLRKSSFFFNKVFLYNGKKYTVERCIDSMYFSKGFIQFKYYLPIKHLVYNNRHLYWISILSYYKRSYNKLYLQWCATKQGR